MSSCKSRTITTNYFRLPRSKGPAGEDSRKTRNQPQSQPAAPRDTNVVGQSVVDIFVARLRGFSVLWPR